MAKNVIPVLAVVFDRKHREKAGHPQPVEIRVTLKSTQKHYPTGVKVNSSEWRSGRVINRPDCDLLNERITVCLRRIEKYITETVDNGKPFDFDELKYVVNKTEEENPTDFYEFIQERAEKRSVSPATRTRYHVLLNNLSEYGKILSFRDLSTKNSTEYDEYLMGRGICQATVYNYHKTMKLFIADAIVFGLMTDDPYKRLRKGFISKGQPPKTEYLTEEEMKAIQSLEIDNGYLAKARDLFVFQMYTGLAYADLRLFDFKDYTLQNGVYVYVGVRKKTGVQYTSVLLPPAIEVLNKYDGKLPLLCNVDYNRQLKTIGALAGISKRLHTHLARHTFATFMLSQGCSIENVSRMVGHSNIKQTQHYAKILAKSVVDDYMRVGQSLIENTTP